MALAPDVTSSTDSNPMEDDSPPVNAPGLQYFVFGLFFIFGGITSLNDVLIPKLRELFTLSYTEAMLIQFCFFAAYLLIGIPGAKLVKKIGYMRGAVAGLCTMIVGCLLFIPASQTATYAIFLGALFILASGVVIVQVVANPLISLLGPPSTAHSRLTFAQALLQVLVMLNVVELAVPESAAIRLALWLRVNLEPLIAAMLEPEPGPIAPGIQPVRRGTDACHNGINVIGMDHRKNRIRVIAQIRGINAKERLHMLADEGTAVGISFRAHPINEEDSRHP